MMKHITFKKLKLEEGYACPMCHSVYKDKSCAEECALRDMLHAETKACPTCKFHDSVINYTSVDCPHKGKGKGMSPPFIADCEGHVPVSWYDMPETEGC